jgi:hypothetical protein
MAGKVCSRRIMMTRLSVINLPFIRDLHSSTFRFVVVTLPEMRLTVSWRFVT